MAVTRCIKNKRRGLNVLVNIMAVIPECFWVTDVNHSLNHASGLGTPNIDARFKPAMLFDGFSSIGQLRVQLP